jgi:hypothetical protein
MTTRNTCELFKKIIEGWVKDHLCCKYQFLKLLKRIDGISQHLVKVFVVFGCPSLVWRENKFLNKSMKVVLFWSIRSWRCQIKIRKLLKQNKQIKAEFLVTIQESRLLCLPTIKRRIRKLSVTCLQNYNNLEKEKELRLVEEQITVSLTTCHQKE